MASAAVPSQAGPHPTEFQLSVGEGKILQFKKKPQIAAVAELVWNALDANATQGDVELCREWDAITQIVVTDNGHGMTPARARAAFAGYGETWKTGKTHTEGNTRILHGHNGEGRLYALALGDRLTWESVAEIDGRLVGVWIGGNADHSTVWQAQETTPARDKTGTAVRIDVPQGKTLRRLERDDAAANLTAKLAFYLMAYPDVCVTFDGRRLDPSDIIVGEPVDLPLSLPEEYTQEDPAPVVTFVEWNQRMSDRRMLICNADGIACTSRVGSGPTVSSASRPTCGPTCSTTSPSTTCTACPCLAAASWMQPPRPSRNTSLYAVPRSPQRWCGS
ncbi:ATP-binding protein [Streptomyces sp. NPDC020747]|uniref:ATP-binding protein n=1 Tax=Streptomyces sp. NPDC020747 TaxID=3365086 RepID=UPI00379B4156